VSICSTIPEDMKVMVLRLIESTPMFGFYPNRTWMHNSNSGLLYFNKKFENKYCFELYNFQNTAFDTLKEERSRHLRTKDAREVEYNKLLEELPNKEDEKEKRQQYDLVKHFETQMTATHERLYSFVQNPCTITQYLLQIEVGKTVITSTNDTSSPIRGLDDDDDI